MSSTIDPVQLAEHNPLVHPAVTSAQLFDYPHAPGDHLLEAYNSLWRACDEDFPYAPTRIARLMPRGSGKTEGLGVVFPTWAILRYPSIRVAVISKTKGLAAERTEKAVEHVSRHAERFNVKIQDQSKTELTTESNGHKEPSLSPYGLTSQLTGKHFDVIIYDDIADWDNQRTETQRRNVRNYFADFVDNLGEPDSALPNGTVQGLIGTRKHPEDIYQTDILDDPRWDTRIYRAIHPDDWGIVESRDWKIRGGDGYLYDDIANLPPDVSIAPDGVIPQRDVRVLWPEQQPPESLLYDIVQGGSSVAIWRRENQQDPQALSGQVFKSEWLVYEEKLPLPREEFAWVAGLDIGLVDDPQKAVEGDTDFNALAVIGVHPSGKTAYLDKLVRERGLSVKGIKDWVVRQLKTYAISTLYVEQNAGRGPGQRLRDETPLPAKEVSSSGSKEERIHSLSSDFQDGTLRIHGSPSDPMWASFEQDEWLQFPTAAHDDRLDAIEIAMRAVSFNSIPTATATVGGGGEYEDTDGDPRNTEEFKSSELGEALEGLRGEDLYR